MNVDEAVPKMVWFTPATTHDHILLSKLKMDSNTIYVFDKGYNDYKAFRMFCENHTGFVTRIKDNAVYELVETLSIEEYIHSGVLQDEIITVTVKDEKGVSKLNLRKVKFYDRELKRVFEFLTNLFEMRADLVAAIYKLRWQIELLFKQLKQNFPLTHIAQKTLPEKKKRLITHLVINNLRWRILQTPLIQIITKPNDFDFEM